VVVGYLLFVYVVVAVRGRPRPVRPGPSTLELRDEPPAVVNLLVNGLNTTRVASATLLDLAARRVLELTEWPTGTFVRVRDAAPQGLMPHERRVFERVQRAAGDRSVPVADLVDRYARGGQQWYGWLVRDARSDARRRGLISRPEQIMPVTAIVAGMLLSLAVVPLVRPSEVFVPWAVLSLVVWVPLLGLAVFVVPDRDGLTAAGRRAAAHWLGVATWIRAHESLRDLPPAAVAVWDRYLAYGVALDVTTHAARVLDFETVGNDDRLWSDATGQWREVRVRHRRPNRLLHPLGRVNALGSLIWSAPMLLLWAAIGAAALSRHGGVTRTVVVALAGVQLVRHAYRVLRSLVELSNPVHVTGTILDVTASNQDLNENPDIDDVPGGYYIVVDDGSSDVLRPWRVTRALIMGAEHTPVHTSPPGTRDHSERQLAYLRHMDFQPGDRVYLKGQRWSHFTTVFKHSPAGENAAPR
jgi:hypothetical protein